MSEETEANREVIRRIFDAWQDGTGAITDVFDRDMVWRIEGHSAASREYASRQAFVEEVLAPFAARFADGERFRPVRVRSIHADGDTVIVVWDGRAWPMTANRTRTPTPGSCKLRDGLVVDGTAFYDSISFNDLWSRVQP